MAGMGGKRTLACRLGSRHHPRMRSVILLAALTVSSCVGLDYGDPPLIVNVRAHGEECRVAVARPSTTQPATFATVHQQELLAIARSERTRRAIVVLDVNAPYKCIGAAIITMQEAAKIVDLATWDSR